MNMEDIVKNVRELTGDDLAEILELADKQMNEGKARWALRSMITHANEFDTFVKRLRDKEVLEGHDVQFECEVANSKLEEKWYKDGNEFELHKYPDINIQNFGRKRRLHIYATSLQDTGEYSCEVNNRKTKAFLDVKAFFTRTLRNKNCFEGDTVTFVCEVTESDTVAQWKKDGINVENNRYNMKQTGKTHQLTILDANRCDNGCFTVEVNGRIREASLNVEACFIQDLNSISCTEGENVIFLCELHTTEEPIVWFHNNSGEITVRVKNCTRRCSLNVRKCFLRQLESKTVREGYSARFHCEVSCPEDVGIWYKDDEKVNSSNKFEITKSGKMNILVVNHTSLDDNGVYSFNVHDIATKASLYVEGYFTKNPRNITCEEGESVNLTCETIEISSPAKWYKDGMNIDENSGTFSKQQNKNQYQLTIRSANKTDSGWYSVNVNDRIRKARVTVKDFFTKLLKDINCNEGDNIKFSCKSIELTSPAKWSKNKEVISNSRCILEHINYTHRLTIKNVEPSDSGHYCINDLFQRYDYFKVRLNDITCKKGDTVRFECEALENGMVVKWYKDNKKINPDKNDNCIVEEKGQVHQLTINNVDTMDYGQYTISVNGRTRTAFLKVEDYSTMILSYITCKEGETARLKCEATENGIEVKWYKDTEEISFDRYIVEQQEQSHQLTRSNIDTMDHGHNIIIVNGRRTRTALLMVKGYSEHEEPFFYCGVGVKFKAQSTKKFDFNQHVSTLKSFTLTNITGGSFQERDACILFSWKLHRSAPPEIITEDKTVHQNLDILLFSENEGQFSLEVLSDVTEYTAFKIATSFQNFKNDSQVGNFEDVLEFLKSGEMKTDFIKPSNAQIKMKPKDKNDSQTTECPRTKSTVSSNEPYRLGKHKVYHRKLQDKIIECENQEKFSTKRWQEYNCDKNRVLRKGWVKMKNSKVKQVTYLRTKKYRLETLVGENCGMDIPSFKRPSVPWQSVNPQLPISFKLRFLDEEHYHALRDHRTSFDFNTLQQDGHPTKQCDSCESDCSCAKNNHGNH
ncbi:OBSCN [Mytilus coruscus]|uniref:OBSCN n=1 Tax=Mytilus coruscus TaxID=42192 RepID=A0A6J8D0L4_MYTCO|nr:OBSCN [Mytilus coruscus]